MKKTDHDKVEKQESVTADEGARKLRLSVTRMKKMRSAVKGGNQVEASSTIDQTGSSVTWNHEQLNRRRGGRGPASVGAPTGGRRTKYTGLRRVSRRGTGANARERWRRAPSTAWRPEAGTRRAAG
ncbi:MAG TPA: hypothetical protein VFS43_05020 [Polyangiaceae bacterium]|nr:hypothetical protein [Polyangiaceae bacterium]